LHLVLSWLLVALVAAAAGVLRLVRMTEGRPLHLSETADVPREGARHGRLELLLSRRGFHP
jgi:hypothetical protein